MSYILEKIENNQELTQDEAVSLYNADLYTLGKVADKIRQEKHGKKVFFNTNRHINPTNMCADYCQFCGFSNHRKNPNGYTFAIEDTLKIATEAVAKGAKELHVVSAHNKHEGADWYFDAFRAIKNAHPNIHLKAMTAAEIEFISREYKMSIDDVIDKMIESGVDSMPGGGAEIFDENLRAKICKGKVSSKDWLDIHRKWHNKGRRSNATMLFGQIETREHRVDHMIRLRDLQKETGGFNAFIPLVYQKENNFLKVENFLSAEEILKTYAISRIVLQNIPHIKAYWVTTTLPLALVAQEYGADDIDGTIQKESINSASGAKSSKGLDPQELTSLIKNAGFIPTERDSLYNEI